MAKMENHTFRKFAHGLCSAFIHAFYRVRVIRPLEIPEGPVLVVANHRHYFDVIAVHVTARRWIYWVAKKELFGSGLFGTIVRKLGAIPVDRDKADLVAARGIFGRLKQGEPVGIFPQGTRVPDRMLAECMPHAGAAHFAIKTGVPIVPVWVDPFRLFRPVRVIYGRPFRLEAKSNAHYSHEELQDYSCQIMRHVFALAGQQYPCTVARPAIVLTVDEPSNGGAEAES